MTTETLKANDNRVACDQIHYVLPLPPLVVMDERDVEIYARFMRHVRMVPSSRMEIKILSAIQFTSDMMDMNDAIVAKTLADMGLRAPRMALPEAYLEYVDRSLMRSGWDIGAPCASTICMKRHWDEIGEDKFAAIRREQKLPSEPAWV